MAIKTLADVHAVWGGDKVKQQVLRAAGKGVKAAALFYESRLREILSVPAPRKLVRGRRGKSAGLSYYRAAVPAVRGQPPRKLSGELRRRQSHEFADLPGGGTRARVGANVIYARRHEKGVHPYMVPTLKAMQHDLAVVVGEPYRAGVV